MFASKVPLKFTATTELPKTKAEELSSFLGISACIMVSNPFLASSTHARLSWFSTF